MRPLLLVLIVAIAASVRAEALVYTLTRGPVHATDHEADECYFNVAFGADAFLITTHPKNVACLRLRELVGKTITLQAVVEP